MPAGALRGFLSTVLEWKPVRWGRAWVETSPFVALWRAFMAQFFASESATAEVQRRQTVAWILAFLITPGLILVVQIQPAYRLAVLRASVLQAPHLPDQILLALGTLFVTFSMVTVGFVAAFVWDALTFDRRDGMVLGPLPVGTATVLTAKAAAMGTLLLGAAAMINLLTAVPFALATSDRPGGSGLLGHFAGHFTATMLAATFVFATVVALRGAVALAAGPRLAGIFGTAVQFVFVSALLCAMLLVPSISPARISLLEVVQVDWMPVFWFIGLFERLLDLSSPRYTGLANRAVPGTALVVVAAALVTVLGYRRQMRLALVPSAFVGVLGSAPVGRLVARAITHRDAAAAAMADFVLITLARCRAQRVPIAMNAAVGVAIVAAALSRYVTGLDDLVKPRTAVLWIPLVLAYWTAIGLRASFFVPSELPAGWTFQANSQTSPLTVWRVVRASMFAFVWPRMVLVLAGVAALAGPWLAAWHAVLATMLLVLLIEGLAVTVSHVPFTREYRAGHARLRTRWPFYVFGLFAFAYWPVQLELRLLGEPVWMLALLASVGLTAIGLHVAAYYGVARRAASPVMEEEEEDDAMTVLNVAVGR